MTNQKIAEILEHISVYLEMEDESFKPRAYEKAAEAIATLPEELAIIYKKGGRKAIQEIHGVGASIAEKIEEALTKGRVKYYEDLKRHMPVELGEPRCASCGIRSAFAGENSSGNRICEVLWGTDGVGICPASCARAL